MLTVPSTLLILLILFGLSAAEALTKDVIALLSLLNVKCVAPLPECLARFTSVVAELLRIVLGSSGVFSFLAFAAFPVLQQKG